MKFPITQRTKQSGWFIIQQVIIQGRRYMYHIRKNAFAYTFEPKFGIILSEFWRFVDGRHTKCVWENKYNLSNSNFVGHLGDNCIQTFLLGRYIVGYRVWNLVLRRLVSRAIKRDFRLYIRRYTSTNENFEYGYPHFNALLTFSLQKVSENVLCYAYTSSGCQLHKTACQLHIFTRQPMKSDVTKWRWVSDSISQDILSQIYDVIQSDVVLHLQVN